MPPAARLGDKTSHGGSIGTPPPAAAVAVATVLIEGKPAAVGGSLHVCVVPKDAVLGPANVVELRVGGQVFIGGMVAARVGDSTTCQANIATGALTVHIGGL
ncbi:MULTISPECIES: PAAR domain-containing protein [Saccharothrix]|uniref:PAAR domain-containing protein n=1 Tax=Saccharothrix TaxID=2071 RepID=UPI000939CEE2|nr:PAAR domain-containing protein [Saccharothrix sp. CB00851]OKI16150.1 hypothetical protein A6A25_12710 [Saccharothrix sp. CB00851]